MSDSTAKSKESRIGRTPTSNSRDHVETRPRPRPRPKIRRPGGPVSRRGADSAKKLNLDLLACSQPRGKENTMNCLRPHAPPSLPRPLLGRLVLFGGTSTSTSTSTSVNTGVGRGGALCTPAAAAAAAAATLGVRHISKKAKEKAKKLEAAQKCAPPPGHGERFWVFNHIEANYVVYSMTPEMRVRVVPLFFLPSPLPPLRLCCVAVCRGLYRVYIYIYYYYYSSSGMRRDETRGAGADTKGTSRVGQNKTE